ncbi:ABC transporter permease [Bordetella genomosp. 12]|uniref:ABC transporter permease n=1 Tax=Bordetella genomosp. 12 TaxID=463035 RepID=A0A261VEG4_9BORD|nr:ABC transporter permease [Bordetella genomosp. 12]OZI71970.1 ABC transporter permease [Bordetella genomosp. 12]
MITNSTPLESYSPASKQLSPAYFSRLIAPGALLLLWQIAVWQGWLDQRLFSSPIQVAQTLWQLARSGELGEHLLTSLWRAGAGLALGLVLGVALALVAGLSRQGENAVDALLQMGRTLPHLALVPLFILWFGIGEAPKIGLVTLGCIFPIYLNLFSGIRGVDRKILEVAQTLGLSRSEQILHIILPGALPSFLVGLRYALSIAWLSLVVGEQINASSGIGYLAMTARDYMRTDIIMSCLLVYALLGLATDALVRHAERRLLAWRPSVLKS